MVLTVIYSDRRQPCGRCARGDRADKCVYEAPKKKLSKSSRTSTASKETNGVQEDLSKPAQEVLVKYRKGKVRYVNIGSFSFFYLHLTDRRHGGRTHWALILHEFNEMREFMHGERAESAGLHKRLKEIKKFFPPKRLQNYPFSPSKDPRYSTREGIIATLPDRAHVSRLVDVYFETFEKVLSLFHEPTFKVELNSFYENPDGTGNGWIASLFCMLAVSHHITTQSTLDSPYLSSANQVEAYLESAQAALHLSPFMLKPTLDDLRALCIIAIGKSLDIVSCTDFRKLTQRLTRMNRSLSTILTHSTSTVASLSGTLSLLACIGTQSMPRGCRPQKRKRDGRSGRQYCFWISGRQSSRGCRS